MPSFVVLHPLGCGKSYQSEGTLSSTGRSPSHHRPHSMAGRLPNYTTDTISSQLRVGRSREKNGVTGCAVVCSRLRKSTSSLCMHNSCFNHRHMWCKIICVLYWELRSYVQYCYRSSIVPWFFQFVAIYDLCTLLICEFINSFTFNFLCVSIILYFKFHACLP